MEKRGIQLSKSLVRASFLSFVTMIVTGLLIYLVVIIIPGTAWSKIIAFLRINSDNPQVYYSSYYLKLSEIVNQQDWIIISPACFLVSGVVFGWLASVKRSIAYVGQRAVIMTLAFCSIIVLLAISGPFAEAKLLSIEGDEMPIPTLDIRLLWMGLLQSAYWSIFYLAGAYAGYRFRNRGQVTVATRQPTNPVPAPTGK